MPIGLEITSTGNPIGYIEPHKPLEGTPPDLMQQTLICNPSTLRTISVEKRYEFVVEVSDSKDVALKTYSLYAASLTCYCRHGLVNYR